MPNTATAAVPCDVKDLTLAADGKRRIEWAFQSMPVLQLIRKQFIKAQPFAGIRITACLPVTTESANLMITLRDGGANPVLCAPALASTQDDVAASLVQDWHIPVFAVSGEDAGMHAAHVTAALDHDPQVTIDTGAVLAAAVSAAQAGGAQSAVCGGTEENARGALRLRALARQTPLAYPVISVNDAFSNHLFSSCYGIGQGTIDGILRATNLLLAGSKVVVLGYGWRGRGIASRARGLGANVIVTEVNPTKALAAVMDGFRVMMMQEAARVGDIFITVTGNKNVIAREHFEHLKDGALLCNSGSSSLEIDTETLGKMAASRRPAQEFIQEFRMRDGRRIHVLADGGSVNVAMDSNPAAVKDMSYATQALCVEYLLKNYGSMDKLCHAVPAAIDEQVARMKLETVGITIDKLTIEQEEYLARWSEGN